MANSGWLVLAAMAFNPTRAAGVAAGDRHRIALTAIIRARLINVAGKITRSARRSTLRLPTNWPWANGFQKLTIAGIGPPPEPDQPTHATQGPRSGRTGPAGHPSCPHPENPTTTSTCRQPRSTTGRTAPSG